ncbi:MAG: response regulator [Flavobacteriaceae bacterium]
MKVLVSLLLIFTICAPATYAQNTPENSRDTLNLSSEERLDTLVKYVRKQFYSNNFGKTIEEGEKTLKLAEELDNSAAILRISSLLGNAFLQLNDTLQAKRIFDKTIAEAEKRKDTTRSLTTARIDLGNLYALQENKWLAIKTYKEAIPLAEKLKDTTHLFVLNYNIAELTLDMERADLAEPYVNKVNLYVQNLNAEAYKAVAKLGTARLLVLKGEYEDALPVLDESIQLAEASGYEDALIESYEVAAKTHIKLKDFEEGSRLLLHLDSLKNEKFKADKVRAVESVTANFKVRQYQQDLIAAELQNEIEQEQLKRETTFFWIKIASAILLIFSFFAYLSYLKRKKLLVNLQLKNQQYLKAKEVSEEQIKAKNQLFSNITHELRTPMYAIVGISSLLKDDKNLQHQKENIDSLKFSADYLLSLINNVLQYTQPKDSPTKLRKVKFNMKEIIEKAIDSSKYLNTLHPNKYLVHIDPLIPEVLVGDDVKLSQILMNLLSNSSKFTKDGTIVVEARNVEEKNGKIGVRFCVKDTGIGISEERQKTIFTEFADPISDFEHQGTGLGLCIVKKLLDLHHSNITLKSELGKGTQISFVIYYKKDKNAPEYIHFPSRIPWQSSLKDKKILVVDDNKINVLVTKKTLEKQGVNVLVAYNGRDGIELAQNQKPDIILMDINMPELNGFETTEIIRTFDQETPIIALTAVEEEKVIAKGKKEIFTNFIIKPYKEADFISLLKSYTTIEV